MLNFSFVKQKFLPFQNTRIGARCFQSHFHKKCIYLIQENFEMYIPFTFVG